MAIKYWITGHKSGLGQFLLRNLNSSVAFDPRVKGAIKKIENVENITLINCGFKRIIPGQEVSYDDFQNNILLQSQLAELSFKRSILCSSVDVYPLDEKMNKETRIISNSDVDSVYSYQKLLNEYFFLKANLGNTVLRLPMLIGSNCQDNSLTKIIRGESIRLTDVSVVNAISYETIAGFIECIETNALSGIFNLVSSANAKLGSLANLIGRDISFGSHTYITPRVSNQKALKFYPALDKTTAEVIENFAMGSL
jgi:nucleoside-diphosphate-sugar epimerase